MKKFLVLFLTLFFSLSLVGCRESGVLEESKAYEVNAPVNSLDIEINAAEFIIQESTAFSVESNLKYLTVTVENGVLNIHEKPPFPISPAYDHPTLTLNIPANTVFEEIELEMGAGELTATTLATKKLDVSLGAGEMTVNTLTVENEVEIEGGAGEITILDGALKNLELSMGTGEFNLTARLLGDCELNFGLGESNITLIGGKDLYAVNIEKGIGNVTVDGQIVNNFTSGNGANHIQIEGGVGSVNLIFQ